MLDKTRKTYFSPDDPCQQSLLDFVNTATKKILIADYSFNLAVLVNDLITLSKMGVTVQLVLDKSQAGGKTEVPEIQMLRDAKIPFVVGTSDKHKIMHDKYIVIDDEWVLSGSYNFTGTAALENNFFDIEHDPARAAVFTQKWQAMWDWISQNEKQL